MQFPRLYVPPTPTEQIDADLSAGLEEWPEWSIRMDRMPLHSEEERVESDPTVTITSGKYSKLGWK